MVLLRFTLGMLAGTLLAAGAFQQIVRISGGGAARRYEVEEA